MQEMTERRKAALEGIFFTFVLARVASDLLVALPAEDQAAVDRMYADQGVAVCYDEPMPFGSAESDKEDDDDGYDTEDEFTDLTKHVSSWSVRGFTCGACFHLTATLGLIQTLVTVGIALQSSMTSGTYK